MLEGREFDQRSGLIREWLLKQYFVPRYGLNANNLEGPTRLARYMISPERDQLRNRTLRGLFTEVYAKELLEPFSAGYKLILSPIAVDRQGIDILVRPYNAYTPIGGFDITNNRRLLQEKESRHEHTRYERVVLPVAYEGIGPIRKGLELHGTFDLRTYVESRIEAREGVDQISLMVSQLNSIILRNEYSGMTSLFNTYLIELRDRLSEHYNLRS